MRKKWRKRYAGVVADSPSASLTRTRYFLWWDEQEPFKNIKFILI